MILRKLANFTILVMFFLVPIVIWLNHFKPFVSMKDFLFVMLSFVSFGLLVISFIFDGKITLKKQRISLAVLIYFLYTVVSFFLLPYTTSSDLLLFTASILLFFTVSYATDARFRNWIICTLFAVSLISSVYGFFQFYGIDYGAFVNYFGSRFEAGTRLFTIFGNPNLLGGFCVFILPLLLAFFVKKYGERKYLLAFLVALIFILAFVTLSLSQTRGSWIAFILSMIVFFVLYFRKKGFDLVKRHVLLSAAALLVVCLVGAGVLWLVFTNENIINPTSANVRLFYYSNTVDMIKDYPLFGRGLGTFNVYYPAYRDNRIAAQKGENEMEYRVEHAHNEHLELISDFGIVGYAIFIWIVLEALYLLLKNDDIVNLGIAVSIVGILIDGLMMQNLRFTVISSLLWLAIAFSTIKHDSQERKLEKVSLMQIVLAIVVMLAIILPIHSAYNTMHADYFVKQAISYYTTSKYEGAAKNFAEALKLDPENKRALYYIAASYNSLGDKKKAIDYYLKLLNLDPNFIQANYQIGMIYLDEKDYLRAKTFFENQIKVNNMYWQAYYYLAVIEHMYGRDDFALEYLNQIDIINGITPIKQEYYDKINELRKLIQVD